MRIAAVILGASALLWGFAYYQLIFNFWPLVIQAAATGEAPFWYRALYPFLFYVYLACPFIFAAAACYIVIVWVWRQFGAAKQV